MSTFIKRGSGLRWSSRLVTLLFTTIVLVLLLGVFVADVDGSQAHYRNYDSGTIDKNKEEAEIEVHGRVRLYNPPPSQRLHREEQTLVERSWWWNAWPWLMVIVASLSLIGYVLVFSRRLVSIVDPISNIRT